MANSKQTQYTDSQLEQLEQERVTAQKEVDAAYDQKLQQVADIYQKQGQAVKDYQNAQAAQQQAQTDFLIDQIGQQQEQARKDYTGEQSAAYTDYQKQVDPYGVNAEAMAAGGMDGTGYSESSRVDMYNTYQNRVATARTSYEQAVRDYDNAIREARLYNSSALAEIAYNALQTQLSLDLEGLQYKQQLEQEQADRKLALDNLYHSRYMDELAQQNWQKSFDYSAAQDRLAQENWQKSFDYGAAQDKLAQENWQKTYQLNAQRQAMQKQLDAAQIMAAAGDFSGYKAALGLTDAQVKKLRDQYIKEVKSAEEAKIYERKLQLAAYLAKGGDYSVYQELFDLTDAQKLELEDEGRVDLNEEEQYLWANRLEEASTWKQMKAIGQEMYDKNIKMERIMALIDLYAWKFGKSNADISFA